MLNTDGLTRLLHYVCKFLININMTSRLVVLILLCGHCLFAQHVFKHKGFKGILFADTVKLNFDLDLAVSRFTPSKDEGLSADRIVIENKKTFISSWGKSFNKELRKSHRQFIGYYDVNGDRHILIFLLNMTNPKSKSYFKEWRNQPLVGFGEFYEKNLKILDVNLSCKMVKIY
jgi:hypothetical protein